MAVLLRKPLATLLRLPATISVGLVRLYRTTLSPDHGPMRHLFPYGVCRHEPTCSSYALEQLKTQPYLKAVWRIVKRVISCNPWTKTSEERLKTVIRRIS